jgi:hypothetical protein
MMDDMRAAAASSVNDIVRLRLQSQYLSGAVRRSAADVVGWFGAVQAQEFFAAKWGLALRMTDGTTEAAVQRAFDSGRILRTHVMRPTWHFVTPRDIRWMLDLTAPRVHQRMRSYNLKLELDSAVLTRATGVIERALGSGPLTRREIADHLARAGLPFKSQRLAHVVLHAELESVICSGPRRQSQFTYALLAERAPNARRLGRDEAIAELTRRYFRSHGPATVRDFVWWSGLVTADAMRGLDMVGARSTAIDGLTYWFAAGAAAADGRQRRCVHLLPVYDEYLVAYRDRDAVPHPSTGAAVAAAFHHPLVLNGRVAGTWRPARAGGGVRIDVVLRKPLPRAARPALAEATTRFGRFAGTAVEVAIL